MHHSSAPLSRRVWLGAVALLLALAGCTPMSAPAPAGTPANTAATTPAVSAAAFPVEVTSGAADSTTKVTINKLPEAIVSLSPTATETLFAIGAGPQVKAVDDQSDYPAEAPRTDLSGFKPNVEAILAQSPDLVVTASKDADLVASLAKASVPTLVVPSAKTFEEAYGQIERIGAATGHTSEAATLISSMKQRIDAAVAKAPNLSGVTYFHELDPALYTVTGNTFIGAVYSLYGLTSIADATAAAGDDYPQLSEEYVVSANPDLILLSDSQCCSVTPELVAQRPGWAGIRAVEQKQVIVLDEDIASRWGPRVADFVENLGEVVSTLELAKA